MSDALTALTRSTRMTAPLVSGAMNHPATIATEHARDVTASIVIPVPVNATSARTMLANRVCSPAPFAVRMFVILVFKMKGVLPVIKSSKTRKPRNRNPTLRFSPFAWAKLLFLRDAGPTEVGGFGICPNDHLLIEDFRLVRQQCTYIHVAFDDASVADHFDEQIDAGLRPEQFARIWIHTHPGDSATPSMTDEETFERVFGNADWSLMFILARRGETYARLRMGSSPKLNVNLNIEIDYSRPFAGTDETQWLAEYGESVSETELFRNSRSKSNFNHKKEPIEHEFDYNWPTERSF
ncbi:MAG: hypothetical protein R3C03_22175 [Pirellulaceae bacterium]